MGSYKQISDQEEQWSCHLCNSAQSKRKSTGVRFYKQLSIQNIPSHKTESESSELLPEQLKALDVLRKMQKAKVNSDLLLNFHLAINFFFPFSGNYET